MEAYRLSRKKFSRVLSGKGSAIKGARWNSVGVEVVYVAVNRSLAMAEVAVHFTLATLPEDYMMLTVFIPDDIAVQKLNDADLPVNWNEFPHSVSTQLIGDRFIGENEYCILQVPSAVTRGDYNLLINPFHSEFKRIKIISVEEFPFDKRIFK
jgi:RES domain-containing protein